MPACRGSNFHRIIHSRPLFASSVNSSDLRLYCGVVVLATVGRPLGKGSGYGWRVDGTATGGQQPPNSAGRRGERPAAVRRLLIGVAWSPVAADSSLSHGELLADVSTADRTRSSGWDMPSSSRACPPMASWAMSSSATCSASEDRGHDHVDRRIVALCSPRTRQQRLIT